MQKTTNYNLNVVELNDAPPDISKVSENFPIIDAILKDHEDLFGSYVALASVKSKGNATTPIYFDANGIPQPTKNFDDYFPKIGGALNGRIVFNEAASREIRSSANDGAVVFRGGTSYQTGSTIILYGKDYSESALSGVARIASSNGTKSAEIRLYPDGTTEAPTPIVTDNSNKIATTSFVKSQGYLTAHQDVSGKLDKSGGTMTGQLTVETNGDPSLVLNNTVGGNVSISLTRGQNAGWKFLNEMGTLRLLTDWGTNGKTDFFEMMTFNNNVVNVLGTIKQNGTAVSLAGHTHEYLASLGTISKAANGYMKFSNGLIIQWGQHTSAAANGVHDISFPTAFTSTNYRVMACMNGNADIANMNVSCYSAVVSASACKVYADGYPYGVDWKNVVNWVAIGY